MNLFYRKNLASIFITSVLFFCIAHNASAVELRFDGGNTEKRLGKSFNIDLFVDSQQEDINALEAEISFSSDTLEIQEVRIGSSIINLWVQEPIVENNIIKFSGIVPGGYGGDGDFVMSLIFKTKKNGPAHINIDRALSLANDGLGTKLNTSFSNFNFDITEDAPVEVVKVGIVDLEKPEPFQPIITKIPDIAGDDYVLLFFTQDKNSGLSHFEIKEGLGFYKRVSSPYILKRQELDVDIYIRAVDKAGNIRQEIIRAPFYSPWYKKIDIYVIIYIVIGIVFLAVLSRGIKTKWKKSKQK